MRRLLTTTQFADALGVSQSSVKRWIDGGRIAATRTAGGHRRVSVDEAVRFIRDAGSKVERPGRLGLPDLAIYIRGKGQAADAATGERLFEYLTDGRAVEASGLLQDRFLAGASVAELVDGPLVQAMTRAGELWRSDGTGILAEHLATQTAIQALNRLRALLRPGPNDFVAVGGAPSGDPYLLPSLAAAAVVESEGFQAVNLGPETPVSTLALGMAARKPRLIWISLSVVAGAEALRRQVLGLAEDARRRGALLVVGGRQAHRLSLRGRKGIYSGSSMAELRAIAHALALSGNAADAAEEA